MIDFVLNALDYAKINTFIEKKFWLAVKNDRNERGLHTCIYNNLIRVIGMLNRHRRPLIGWFDRNIIEWLKRDSCTQ